MNRIEKLRKHIDELIMNIPDIEERRCAYQHLYGVSQACAMIALKRNQNAELAIIAGMLHDLYYYKNPDIDHHAENGAVLAREILEVLELTTSDETDLICSAIIYHSEKDKIHSEFDEILVDADVLQHCLYNTTLPVKEHERMRYNNLMKEFGINRSIMPKPAVKPQLDKILI